MAELVDSVKRHGIIQPVAVMPGNADATFYVIVAGERRWRAAQEAGLKEIPVIVLRKLPPRDLMEFALVENLQREDLLPLEEARAYYSLQDRFGLTAEQIAERVGKSRPAVANSLRLLSLRKDMQEDLDAGRITPGHARAILSLENVRDQVRLRDTILQQGMSVRQAEGRARQMIDGGAARKGKAHSAASSPSETQREGFEHIQRLREQLVDALSCRVNISVQADNRGKIEIYYDSLDDLQNLLDALEIRI
jgi:ParB family chromosome partitioning protein